MRNHKEYLQNLMLKKTYLTPQLKKLGTIKNITLKAGSTSDSSMPRVA